MWLREASRPITINIKRRIFYSEKYGLQIQIIVIIEFLDAVASLALGHDCHSLIKVHKRLKD